MLSRLINLQKQAVVAVLAVGAISVALLASRGLEKDYTIEAFVASGSESYAVFRRHMEEFVSNEFALIAVQSREPRSESAMAVVTNLAAQVRSLPAVQQATSLADIPWGVRAALGERLLTHPLIVDSLVSRDGRTNAILLQMAGEGATGVVRRETVARLKHIVETARIENEDLRIILAGPYVTLIDMYDYVDQDLRVFSIAAFVLVLVTLGVVFRRPAPVLFALLVAGSATVCTLGVASAFRIPTTLVTQMVVILVMVLSVATCVHLAVAEDEEFCRAPFYDWRERGRRVLTRMAAPCTAVIVTTATGFGAVSISSIRPVRIFGLLMVLGLALSLIYALVVLPSMARIRAPADRANPPEALPRILRRLGSWVAANRWRVIGGFTVVAAGFAVSLPWLKFESDFVKNFRPESEVRQSYEFIESNLSPTGSMEVVVRRRDGGTVVSADCVAKLREAGEQAVATFEPVKKALTLADMLTLGVGRTPSTTIEIDARLALVRGLFGEQMIRTFLNASATASRINLRVSEGISVQQKLDMADDVARMAADVFGAEYDIEVTGLYPFYASLVADLWTDQFRSLGITIPAVLLVLIVVLRSFKAGLVAMIPTTLPVLFCLGAMGWTGIPVNMTTATMLSVTVGIAVDDAVHYLWRFRSALRETGDYNMALRDAQGSVGQACVFTTVVIAGGFWILTLSRFLPTAYFGGLLGFTMCWALATDLVLLPALIMTFKPFSTPKSV